MDFIKSIDIIRNQIHEWSPQDIAFIRDFNYQTLEDNSVRFILSAISQPRSNHWPDFKKKFWEISLEFVDIRSLKIKQPDGFNHIQVCGFVIEDVKSKQLENINIEVYDYEDDLISFYAKSVEVKSCKEVQGFTKQFPFEVVNS